MRDEFSSLKQPLRVAIMATIPPITTLTEGETTEDVSAAEPESGAAAPCECDTFESGLEFHLEGIDNRERALPVRQGDLTRLLLGRAGACREGDRDHLAAFGRILGRDVPQRVLREAPRAEGALRPARPRLRLRPPARTTPAARPSASDEEFLVPFEATLVRANYRPPRPATSSRQAVSAPNEMGLTYMPDFSLFEHLKVYVRGYTRITRDCRNVQTRFRKRTVHLDAYQRLVVALKFKPDPKLGPARPLRRALPADVQGRAARRHGDAPARAGDQGPDALDRQGADRLAARDRHPHDRS